LDVSLGYEQTSLPAGFFPCSDSATRLACRYDLSILQAEFSLTQVLDQPVTGRIFFEEVIRENLDIRRLAQVHNPIHGRPHEAPGSPGSAP
jgi:hypothetical protein